VTFPPFSMKLPTTRNAIRSGSTSPLRRDHTFEERGLAML
jgi:hypothetical protein